MSIWEKNIALSRNESKLTDTFFGSWDQIKHNIILHWVDLAEQEGDNAPFDYAAFKEEQYDKLADLVRKHVDMEYIYSTL